MGRLEKIRTAQPSESGSNCSLPQSDTSPTIIIAPPTAVDNQADCFRRSDAKPLKNIVYRVLDILKGARPGSDLTQLHIPAQFNLPKSQVQCYTEQVYCCSQNLLEKCADGATPLDRFLAVLAWRFSMIRPVPYCKVPYNPVLGETHHVSAGDLNVLAEQVSHHPPITVVHATNEKKGIEFIQSNTPIPKFCGNSVDVSILGRQTLTLAKHGETYEITPPKLTFRFLPYLCSEWTGETVVRCIETGLQGTLSFKPRSILNIRGASNKVCGTIRSAEKVLFTLSGSWEKTVILEDVETGNKSILYDAGAALTNLSTPVIKNQNALSKMESVFVWRELTDGLWNQDWEAARKAKLRVEEDHRALRKEREKACEIWEPKYFTQTEEKDWVWALKGHPIPEGPIVW